MNAVFRRSLWRFLEILYRLYVGVAMSVLSQVDYGTNVYGRDWDVLLVLDTARVDAMRQVEPEFDFVDSVDSIRSVGSTSSEWIANTFVDEYTLEIENTILVSANPHVQHTLYDRQFPEHDKDAYLAYTSWDTVRADQFALIDQPWKYATHERYDHVLPEKITERAVSLYREHEPDRMIVHYMQPHRPHFSTAYQAGREMTDAERDPFTHLKNGGHWETVYGNHVSDLKFVLKTGVEPLIRNIDADRVAITADHGDGFGEQLCYAHIAGDPRRPVRRVPWVETEARDRGTLEPTLRPPETDTQDLDSQLEALGYV